MLSAAARAAAARGYETTICFSAVARGQPWLSELQGLADVRFLEGSGTRTQLGEIAQVLSQDRRPGILHTHFATFDVAAALLRLRAAAGAVFWHEHGPILTDLPTRLRNTVRYAVLGRWVDAVLCVSPDIRRALRARLAPPAKLHDFPNAIDLGRFPSVTADQQLRARRALGLPERAPIALHFGWDWFRKGGDRMVAAADAVLARNPDFRVLSVVGRDSRASLDATGHHPAIIAVPPTDDVSRLYAASDVFLNCSRAEGMPYALLEALASGLRTVATDLPIQAQAISLLPGARIVDGEPASIAAAILELLDLAREQRERHRVDARERVAAGFALEPWAERLVDLYDRAGRRGGHLSWESGAVP